MTFYICLLLAIVGTIIAYLVYPITTSGNTRVRELVVVFSIVVSIVSGVLMIIGLCSHLGGAMALNKYTFTKEAVILYTEDMPKESRLRLYDRVADVNADIEERKILMRSFPIADLLIPEYIRDLDKIVFPEGKE